MRFEDFGKALNILSSQTMMDYLKQKQNSADDFRITYTSFVNGELYIEYESVNTIVEAWYCVYIDESLYNELYKSYRNEVE